MASRASSVDADGESDDGVGIPLGLAIDPSLFEAEPATATAGSSQLDPSPRRSSRSNSARQVYHEEPMIPASQSSSNADHPDHYAEEEEEEEGQSSYPPDPYDYPPPGEADPYDEADGEEDGLIPYDGAYLARPYPASSSMGEVGGAEETGLPETSLDVAGSGNGLNTAGGEAGPSSPTRKRRRIDSANPSPSMGPASRPPPLSRSASKLPPSQSTKPKPKSKQSSTTSTSHAGPRPKQTPTAFAIGNGQYLVSANGKPPRETECSFCLGTDEKNKLGEREWMLSCDKCGRSGHPTCLSMVSASLRAKVRTYSWQCIECKMCEICDSKGEDNRLMFCDGCDRGWHSYCLNPPLEKPPKGVWKCPICVSERDALASSKKRGSSQASSSAAGTVNGTILVPPYNNNKGVNGRGPRNGLGPAGLDSVAASTFAPHINIKFKGKGKERMLDEADDRLQQTPNGFRNKPGRKPMGFKDPSRSTPVLKLKLTMPHGEGTPVVRSKKRGRPFKYPRPEEQEEQEEVYEKESTPVPFGGVIEGAEADTSHTQISQADKAAFEKSRTAADLKLGSELPERDDDMDYRERSVSPDPIALGSPAQGQSPPTHGSTFRPLRDRLLLQHTASGVHPLTAGAGSSTRPNLATSSSALDAQPTVSEKIKRIRFGQFDIETWYAAPYPEEYAKVPDGRLWICEFCLKYMKSGFVAGRHQLKCKTRHPPGDEIYREGSVSVFEVDGRKNKIYCQNLCLIAKMFLDHKTLYYDVEPFLFYVMTEVDEDGAKFVGYFSKEKRSATNNVSCIMTLPVRQRKGWGNLLIDFSYLLSKKEGRTGSPEKPLSGLGALSYRNYWTTTVFKFLDTAVPPVTLDQIATSTSMMHEDVFTTLEQNKMIDVFDSAAEMARRKEEPAGFWPNAGIARQALSRNNLPAERTAIPVHYQIRWDQAVIQAHLDKVASKGWLKLRPEKLKYTPFLVTRVAFGKDGMLVPKVMSHVQADNYPEDHLLTAEEVAGLENSLDASNEAGPSQKYPVEEHVSKGVELAAPDAPAEVQPVEEDADMMDIDHDISASATEDADLDEDEDFQPDGDGEDEGEDEIEGERTVSRSGSRRRETPTILPITPPRRSSMRVGVSASLSENGSPSASTKKGPTPTARETRGSSRLVRG